MSELKAVFSQLLMKRTFLTSQKSIRPRRHFVPKTVSSRFKIETLWAEPLQTKSLLPRPLSQNLPQYRRHSDVKIAIMLKTTNWTNEDLFVEVLATWNIVGTPGVPVHQLPMVTRNERQNMASSYSEPEVRPTVSTYPRELPFDPIRTTDNILC